MLDEKDLQAIGALLDNRLSNTENLILEEVDRVQTSLDTKIKQLNKTVLSEII